MKKTIALILALCMVFALAACGRKSAAPSPAKDPICPENPRNSPTMVKNAAIANSAQSNAVRSTYSSFR